MPNLCKCPENEIGSIGFSDSFRCLIYTCNICHKIIGFIKEESIGVEWDYWGTDNWIEAVKRARG